MHAYFRLSPAQVSHPTSSLFVSLCLTSSSSSPLSHGCLPSSPSEWQWYWCKMCRLWAAEAYNLCMPGPATTTLYGFIVSPFMSSPVGVGGQQFRKFTVYVSVSGAEIMRVLTCASACSLYPDQLVRVQPLKNQCVNMYVSTHEPCILRRSWPTSLHLPPATLGNYFSQWSRMKQVE